MSRKPRKLRGDLLNDPIGMQAIAANGGVWTVERIAYLRLQYAGTGSPYTFSYAAPGPGYYKFPQSMSKALFLALFLENLRSAPANHPGAPDELITLNSDGILKFTLIYNSYVIFHLDPSLSWRYSNCYDGLSTNDETAGDYFALNHYTDDGNGLVPGCGNLPIITPNVSPFHNDCHIAYFSAVSPSWEGGKIPPVDDAFNINVFINGVETPIDPDIKNTGHDGRGGGTGTGGR